MVMGFKGRLDKEGVNTLETYLNKEKRIMNKEEKGFSPFTPLYEANMKFEPVKIEVDENNYNSKVEEFYKSQIDSGNFIPGAFGDYLRIMKTDEGFYITEMGNKAFPKASEAGDLGMQVISNDNQIYSVFIKRKNEPGKGNAAFAGGFCNKKEGHIDSPIYTVIKEASEEFNFKCESDIEKYRTNYNLSNLEVTVLLGDKNYKGSLEFAGTYKTSNELMKNGGERLSENSEKLRVDKTHFYILTVKTDLKSDELEKALISQYEAGDDASDVIIENITKYAINNDSKGLNDKLKCGIIHHKDLVETLVNKAHETMLS